MDHRLKIGELARTAGVTPKAIRFYERKRILPPARRATNRYRLYGAEAVDMLRFIKQATGLGLTLADIREIITSTDRSESPGLEAPADRGRNRLTAYRYARRPRAQTTATPMKTTHRSEEA